MGKLYYMIYWLATFTQGAKGLTEKAIRPKVKHSALLITKQPATNYLNGKPQTYTVIVKKLIW